LTVRLNCPISLHRSGPSLAVRLVHTYLSHGSPILPMLAADVELLPQHQLDYNGYEGAMFRRIWPLIQSRRAPVTNAPHRTQTAVRDAIACVSARQGYGAARCLVLKVMYHVTSGYVFFVFVHIIYSKASRTYDPLRSRTLFLKQSDVHLQVASI
jgi:hypothetical protein